MIEVKGKRHSLRVFPFQGVRALRQVERPALVGREPDLHQLELLWERTLAEATTSGLHCGHGRDRQNAPFGGVSSSPRSGGGVPGRARTLSALRADFDLLAPTWPANRAAGRRNRQTSGRGCVCTGWTDVGRRSTSGYFCANHTRL